jgi:hypothetical protein
VFGDSLECAEIDLQQHGDNHQPDKQRHRQINLCDLKPADKLERAVEKVPQRDTGKNAEEHPGGKITLKETHAGPGGFFCRGFALCTHAPVPCRSAARTSSRSCTR